MQPFYFPYPSAADGAALLTGSRLSVKEIGAVNWGKSRLNG